MQRGKITNKRGNKTRNICQFSNYPQTVELWFALSNKKNIGRNDSIPLLFFSTKLATESSGIEYSPTLSDSDIDFNIEYSESQLRIYFQLIDSFYISTQ